MGEISILIVLIKAWHAAFLYYKVANSLLTKSCLNVASDSNVQKPPGYLVSEVFGACPAGRRPWGGNTGLGTSQCPLRGAGRDELARGTCDLTSCISLFPILTFCFSAWPLTSYFQPYSQHL